jgi:hypothetical protein
MTIATIEVRDIADIKPLIDAGFRVRGVNKSHDYIVVVEKEGDAVGELIRLAMKTNDRRNEERERQ